MVDQGYFSMTDFFAADCGHCQQLGPVWDEAARSSSHLPIHWDSKECFADGWTTGKDAQFCKDMHVNQFPTVKLIHYDSNGNVDHSFDFTGSRTVRSLLDFARDHVPQKILEQNMAGLGFFCFERVLRDTSGFL